MIDFGNDWTDILAPEFEKDYYISLRRTLASEYRSATVYPDMHDIFNALKHTPLGSVKAVIIGQDPYHGPGQAHGLSFSVKKGVRKPPSLQNIFKELNSDLGVPVPSHGELTEWAQNGVLLLNTVLTVRAGEPNSHAALGWHHFTDCIITQINNRAKPAVLMLWGNNAKTKGKLITNPAHMILTAAHPSPLSAHNGFFGCRHFSRANEFLIKNGIAPVQWTIGDNSEKI